MIILNMASVQIDVSLDTKFESPLCKGPIDEWVVPIQSTPKTFMHYLLRLAHDTKSAIVALGSLSHFDSLWKLFQHLQLKYWGRVYLHKECPKYHGHKGDPGVPPESRGASDPSEGEGPKRWKYLLSTKTRSLEGKTMGYE